MVTWYLVVYSLYCSLWSRLYVHSKPTSPGKEHNYTPKEHTFHQTVLLLTACGAGNLILAHKGGDGQDHKLGHHSLWYRKFSTHIWNPKFLHVYVQCQISPFMAYTLIPANESSTHVGNGWFTSYFQSVCAIMQEFRKHMSPVMMLSNLPWHYN